MEIEPGLTPWVATPAGRGQGAGRGGGGAGPGWTSARGGPAASRSNPAPGLRAAPGALCLVGRHGAACGRVRPGRGPGAALGGRRVGPHGGVGAAQVREPAPGRSWRVGAAGGERPR